MDLASRCAFTLLLSCAPFALFGRDGPACERDPLARWEVRLDHDVPVVEGIANGARVAVLIDTGAAASLLAEEAAHRLGIVARTSPERMRGIGGDSSVRVARLAQLRIGAWSAAEMPVRVGEIRAVPGVDLVLGEDVLHALDIELDYASRAVRLFDPGQCRDAWLATWNASAQVLPLEPGDRAIALTVLVNGSATGAILDSGATRSMASLELAYRSDLAPDAPGVVPGGCVAGFAGEALQSWIGRFDTVQLAGETVRDARIAFADFSVAADAPLLRAPALSFARRGPDLLLGNDFLRAHRVLVARGQGRVYFSRTGAPVFTPRPAVRCEGASR